MYHLIECYFDLRDRRWDLYYGNYRRDSRRCHGFTVPRALHVERCLILLEAFDSAKERGEVRRKIP